MKKLIVPFNKQQAQLLLTVCPYMVAFLCLLLLAAFGIEIIFGYYVRIIIQSILFSCIVLFLILFAYSSVQLHNDEPLAILDEQGIRIKHHGFIPWGNISEFAPYKVPGAPIEVIGIRVKNIPFFSKKTPFGLKSGMFWSKIFGYPPISLASLDMDNNQIVSFAQQFLKNHDGR
jgi:hypothetical protein